jgi:pimeloyl-ACP methyl ester carboxylesterase
MPTYRTLLPTVLLLLLAAMPVAPVFAAPAPPAGTGATAIGREGLTINFGDFQSHAELDYPAKTPGKLPTVLLIPGSGPEDLNATITSGPGQPALSHIFLDIANYLAPRGFAVLRYNKHYVTSATEVDYQRFYTKLTLAQMLQDANQVLKTAEADPHIDASRIFLYGWSEGSTVAAALAVQHPELAGLIVQGPVAEPWQDLFRYQILDVGVPYLRQFAPNGKVTVATLKAAAAGKGGLVAKGIVGYLSDPNESPGTVALNPLIDREHRGVIDIDTQFIPAVDPILDYALGLNGYLGIYGPGRALPTVTEQASRLHLPVLILQGAQDANVPVAGARTLAAALQGNPDHTLKIYPDLGHSLGPATSPIDDNFRPIAQAPLADLAAWLGAHSQSVGQMPMGTVQIPAHMPSTGAGGMAAKS